MVGEIWEYSKVIEEFEKLLHQIQIECRLSKHNGKERVYDIAHVSLAYLCDDCDFKFRWAWNEIVKRHVSNDVIQKSIESWQRENIKRAVELGLVRDAGETKPRFLVVFKQGSNKVATAGEYDNYDEAIKVATVLNDGLQDKARAMGFKYVVEVL